MATFDFEQQMRGPWETASGFLVLQFQQLLAQLAPLDPLVSLAYTPNAVLVTDASGTPSWSATLRTAASVTRVTQSIPNGVNTAISFTTVPPFDSGPYYASATPTRLTAPVTGNFHVTASLQWTGSVAGNQRMIFLTKNGTDAGDGTDPTKHYGMSQIGNYAAGVNSAMTVAAIVNLKAGEYIQLIAYQDTAGALNMTQARLSIAQI